MQLGLPPTLLGRFYPRQGLHQGLQSGLRLPRLAIRFGQCGESEGASKLGASYTLMRRQPLADQRYTLASVSLHGQCPAPQDASLLASKDKPLFTGEGD
jgi:hypothetical protein